MAESSSCDVDDHTVPHVLGLLNPIPSKSDWKSEGFNILRGVKGNRAIK